MYIYITHVYVCIYISISTCIDGLNNGGNASHKAGYVAEFVPPQKKNAMLQILISKAEHL